MSIDFDDQILFKMVFVRRILWEFSEWYNMDFVIFNTLRKSPHIFILWADWLFKFSVLQVNIFFYLGLPY